MADYGERIRSLLAARRRTVDNVARPGMPVLIKTRSPEMAAALDELSQHRLGDKLVPEREITALQGQFFREGVGEQLRGRFHSTAGLRPYDGMITYEPGDRATRRHEVMHAYNDAARRGVPGMPLASRTAASLPEFLGLPLDELIARRAEGQGFVDVPWETYAKMYAAQGDIGAARTALALHAASRAGRAASDYAPHLAGAAVGGGMLTYGLLKEDE